MAESMLMSKDEIAAADAALDPGRDADKPEPRSRKEPEPEPDIEYVGPEDKDGDEPKAADKNKADKPVDKAKKPEERAKPPEGYVDRNAFVAEREARRREKAEWEARERAREEKLAYLAGQIAQVNQAQQVQAQPKDQQPEPKWEDDPRAYTEYHLQRSRAETEQARAETAQLREYLGQQHQQTAAQKQQQDYNEYYENAIDVSEKQAAQVAPDYYAAVTALRNQRARELSLQPKYSGNPHALEAQLRKEAIEIAEDAVRNGMLPAVVFYQTAVARGWQPEMAQQQAPVQQQQPDRQPQKGNGAAAQIEQLAKAKEASEGLSNAGGSAPSATRMSLETLDRMTNKEIQAWVARESKKGPEAIDNALQKMMDGR